MREGKNILFADGIDSHHGYLHTGTVLQGNEQTINLRRCIGVYEAIRAETWLPLIWRGLGTDSTVAEAANAEVQAISRLSKK